MLVFINIIILNLFSVDSPFYAMAANACEKKNDWEGNFAFTFFLEKIVFLQITSEVFLLD